MRTTTTYDEVWTRRTYRWTMADGKRKQKTKKFFQTLNPFNHIDGVPKDAQQIRREIYKEAAEWVEMMDKLNQAGQLPGQANHVK